MSVTQLRNGKGHQQGEIDASDGVMGEVADKSGIQF